MVISLESTRAARIDGTDRGLRRAAAAGDLVRLRAGVFAPRDGLDEATSVERRAAEVRAVVGTRRSAVVVSHGSAAALWGLPHITSAHDVHITEPIHSARRSKNGVVVHRMPLAEGDVDLIDGTLVTGLVRTLFDLARDAPFVDALAALDRALDVRDPLTTREVLDSYFRSHPGRGAVRALEILACADGLSETPLETFGRGTMLELGFPRPTLQFEVRVRSGRRRRMDYWWEKYRVGAEADGRIKYADMPAEAFWAEKRREAELADVRVRFTRFGWEDCVTPSRLATRLLALGLPRTPTAIRL